MSHDLYYGSENTRSRTCSICGLSFEYESIPGYRDPSDRDCPNGCDDEPPKDNLTEYRTKLSQTYSKDYQEGLV